MMVILRLKIMILLSETQFPTLLYLLSYQVLKDLGIIVEVIIMTILILITVV